MAQSAHLVCMNSGVPSPAPHEPGRAVHTYNPSTQHLEGRKIRSSRSPPDTSGGQPELTSTNKQASKQQARDVCQSTCLPCARPEDLIPSSDLYSTRTYMCIEIKLSRPKIKENISIMSYPENCVPNILEFPPAHMFFPCSPLCPLPWRG